MSRTFAILVFLTGLLAAMIALRLKVGGPLPPGSDMILEFRAQRAVAGAVVGLCLGVSGVLLQCLFRNPLAAPDVLGMSSGAGLSVMLWQLGAYLAGMGIAQSSVDIGVALPGAIGALLLTYLLAQRKGTVEPVSLILTGVLIGVVAAALSSLVQQFLPDRGVAAARLLLGSINEELRWKGLAIAGGIALAGLAWSVFRGRALDAASLSDDEARSLGVALGRLRLEMFVLAGLLTSVAFSLAGPVAFVGLVCPHLVRMVLGPRHAPLVCGAACLSGVMVVGADCLVRVIDLGSGRLPLSVMTALVGGPVLIWMLRVNAGRIRPVV
ncbi:MAG TPA: iron ABC transporter permease [Phycisphaerales bacterium]